jgi:hypothetical protein
MNRARSRLAQLALLLRAFCGQTFGGRTIFAGRPAYRLVFWLGPPCPPLPVMVLRRDLAVQNPEHGAGEDGVVVEEGADTLQGRAPRSLLRPRLATYLGGIRGVA